MKTNVGFIRILALIILTGSLSQACKKDETSTNTKDIVGTWTSGSISYTAMVGDKSITEYLIQDAGYTSVVAQQFAAIFDQMAKQQFSGTIQVKSDGTYTSTLGGSNDTGTWDLSSDGKTLTVYPSTDPPVTFNVVELSSTKLHVKFTQTEEEDLNEDGTPESIVINADITFTKA
jgi:ABC-type oligopeptide transport system substrate-binding subunit